MIHSKRLFSKYTGFGVGPGGLQCSCCAPPPHKRKKLFRIGRKQLNRAVFKIEREQEEQ
ncbi:hypothetical protein D3C86_982970 [compost metagenome]